MASLVEQLEERMRRSGLSGRELAALKQARQEESDSRPGSIAYEMQRRANNEAEQQSAFERDQAANRAAMREQYLRDVSSGDQQLIGAENLSRGSSGGQRGIIGAEEKAPEQYIYRELATGEEYDPRTDIFMSNEKGEAVRRKAVNPDYQKYVVAQAAKVAAEKQGGQGAPKAPPPEVMTAYTKLLEDRRSAASPADAAKYDDQIAAYQRAYPQLAGGAMATGGAGGAQEITADQAGAAMQEAGIPPQAAQKLLGVAAQGNKPTWNWQDSVSVSPIGG